MGSRSESTQSLPAWARPYAESLLRTGTGLVAPGATIAGKPAAEDTLPILQAPPDLYQQIAGFNPTQQAGMDYLTGSAGASAGLAGAGAGQVGQTLRGDYLNANPYLNSTFADAAYNLTDQYKSATAPSLLAQAQQAGVYGGSAMNEQQDRNETDLSRGLASLASQIYGGNYQTERGRQLESANMIPQLQQSIAAPGQQLLGVGTLQQGQTQTELDAAKANAELKQEFPIKLLSYLGNLMGTATGSGGVAGVSTSK